MSSYLSKRPRCCLMTSSLLVFLVVYVNSMCIPPAAASASFEFNAYCQKLCLWGRGGNLCRCNAVHFVGKRRVVTSPHTSAGDVINVSGSGSTVDDQLQERLREETGLDGGLTIDVVDEEVQSASTRQKDNELDDEGSGGLASLAAAAGSPSGEGDSGDRISGTSTGIVINGSQVIGNVLLTPEDPTEVAADSPSSAGSPQAGIGFDMDMDIVGDLQGKQPPVIVASQESDDGTLEDDVGGVVEEKTDKMKKRWTVNRGEQVKLQKFGKKHRRNSNSNHHMSSGVARGNTGSGGKMAVNGSNRQKFITLNMLTRKPASFRLVKPNVPSLPPRMHKWS